MTDQRNTEQQPQGGGGGPVEAPSPRHDSANHSIREIEGGASIGTRAQPGAIPADITTTNASPPKDRPGDRPRAGHGGTDVTGSGATHAGGATPGG